MCKHAKEHPRPESVHYISVSLHVLPGNESPPLAGTRGDHFVLPAPLQRRQLCSYEEISEAAGTHGVSFGSMSSGLITHATTAAMACPWTAWTSGCLSIAVTCEALAPWRNPDLFSRGVPLGLVASRVVVTTDASTLGWGAVCEGMPASGLWSEPQTWWHINRLELEAVF